MWGSSEVGTHVGSFWKKLPKNQTWGALPINSTFQNMMGLAEDFTGYKSF
jgi:hypothetical protein